MRVTFKSIIKLYMFVSVYYFNINVNFLSTSTYLIFSKLHDMELFQGLPTSRFASTRIRQLLFSYAEYPQDRHSFREIG